MHQSLETHKLEKPVITGNLIFSNNKNKDNYKNKYLLCNNPKGFTNMQYLVNMFYDFEILNDLNDLSKEVKFEIVVKIHPQFSMCKDDLAKHFKSLKFTNSRIDKLLEALFHWLLYHLERLRTH